jgi:hypothetical protein
MRGFSLWNDCVVIRFASKRFGLVVGENRDGSLWFLSGYGYYRSVFFWRVSLCLSLLVASSQL